MFLRNLAALVLFAAFTLAAIYSQFVGEIKLHIIDPSSASLRASGRLNGPGGIYRTFETAGQGDLDLTGPAPEYYGFLVIPDASPRSIYLPLVS